MPLQLFTPGFGLGGFSDPFVDMDRMMGMVLDPFSTRPRGELSRATPAFPSLRMVQQHAMDIEEHPTKFCIKADVPGMTPEDIRVELKEGVLTVSGEKKNEAENTEEKDGVRTYRKERTFSKFTRSFVLPENIITDEIAARVDHGVLTLDIPKKPEEAPKLSEAKRIPVLTNGGTKKAAVEAPTSTTEPTAPTSEAPAPTTTPTDA